MYKNILHATDLKENHFPLCEKAAALAKQFNAKLFLLHVIEPPASLQLAQSLGFAEFDKPVKDDAESVINVVGDALNIPVESQFVEIGSTKLHIIELAETLSCDLIIIGRHEPHQIPSFLGSTANAVLHNAKCDVLTLNSN